MFSTIQRAVCCSFRLGCLITILFVSSDDGVTWNPISAELDENGFAFSDSLHGMLSAFGSPYYLTSDGGQTWYGIGYIKHSWSPAAIPGTATFVAAGDLTNSIYASTDTGATWALSSTVAGTLTGCVQTGPCTVYVQSSDGIYHSQDLLNWILIPGSPSNNFDSRFYVGPNTMYAGDGTGDLLAHASLGGCWTTLRFSQKALHVSRAAGCAPKTDTITFNNSTCLPLTILSASVTDSIVWSYIPGRPLPLTLATGDTTRFTITANDDTTGVFHDQLQLWLRTSAGTIDTVVLLDLNAVPLLGPSMTAPKVSLPDRCTSIDTVFTIRNNNCDTIHLTSLAMLDTSLFHLLPFTLPISIPPDSELIIPLSVLPEGKGTFIDTVAMTFASNGFSLDTTLVLNGTVQVSAISAHFSANAMTFDTLLQCQTKLDTIFLSNASCDSFQITLSVLGSTRFALADSVLGQWIIPGDSVALVIELSGNQAPGKYSDILSLVLNNGGAQESYNIPIAGAVQHTQPTVVLSASAIHTDSISGCSAFDTVIYFTALTDCDSVTIASMNYSGTGNVIVTASPPLPRVLRSGDTLQCVVNYTPNGSGIIDGTIQAQGNGIDTSIPLHLSIRDDVQPIQLSINPTSFAVHPCNIDSATVTLANPGCVAVTLDSLSLSSGLSQFTLKIPALPLSIPADSTITTTIYFSADGATTALSVLDTIQTYDETGHMGQVAVTGTILPIDTAHVGIALAPGSTLHPIAGGMTNALLFFNDTVPASDDLQSLHCVITFNGNVLTEVGSVTGLSGWSVPATSTLGMISMTCTRSNGTSISPGTPIASVQLQADLSDSLSTPITLSNVTFSPSDPTYEQCMLASAIAPPSIQIQLTPQCGDSIILLALRGEPLLTSIEIVPQESNLIVTFQSQTACNVTIALCDILGRTHTDISYQAMQGMNATTLPTSTIAEGIYFVEVCAGDTRVMKQVVLFR